MFAGQLFLVLVLLFYQSSVAFSDEKYELLPRKYDLEDPRECSRNNGIYCKISVTLTKRRGFNTSESWKIIEEYKKDYRYFDHANLLHGRCFKKNQMKTLRENLKQRYASIYQNYSLHGNVENVTCHEDGRLFLDDLDYWDLLFMSVGAIYGLLMVVATAYTALADHQKENIVAKTLSIFSFFTIWRELRQPIKNEDFQNLKSIQGLRTLTMMLIISSHAFYGNMFNFVRNPEFVENIYMNLITRGIILIFTFLVQTFFLISAWLLSVQLERILNKNGELTFKDIFLLGFNRYFRLIPVVAVLAVVLRSNLAYDLVSYINEDIIEREVDICRYYWWKNFFFIQNFYEPDKICSAVTWYLATDYQLYLLSLLIFYVSHKLKINRNVLIGLVVVVGITIQVVVIAITDFQGFLRLFPKTANLANMLVSKAFTLSYVPPWCNSTTYMIGLIFGAIYTKRKQENIFDNICKKIMWCIGFLGLPIFAIFIASFPYENRFYETLLAVSTRSIFAIGIGIGILGMATKTGGLLKMLLESPPLVFLANFCYCVYLSHYAFVYLRIMRGDEMVDLSLFYIAKYTVIDYFLSFSFGAFVYMAIEHPISQVQKLIFPQVSTKKRSFKESTISPFKTIPVLRMSSDKL